MTALKQVGAFALTFLLVPTLCAVLLQSSAVQKSSSSAAKDDPDLIQPLAFQQDLVVCNAYGGTTRKQTSMHVKQNGQHIHGHVRGIPYKQCRQVSTAVRNKDKIDVDFGSIQGSFEIGDLPENDAFLVLVVEKRDTSSPLLAFQSYAFPVTPDGDVAHLAVVDTLKETSHFPSLRMEDHVSEHNDDNVPFKRVQQLKFNNVYNVQEGSYDAAILDHDQVAGSDERGKQVSKGSKRLLNLKKNMNYVVLRIGDGAEKNAGDSKDISLRGQSLAVYPDLNSGAMRCTVAIVSVFVSFLLLENAIESYPILATLM